MDIASAVDWPPIDSEVIKAVVDQLKLATSIYDGSGVFAEFESEFARFHNIKYALTVSSGTAALHSAFFALRLGVGDEVICPDYTFFATATPLFQIGAQPVLVDCAPDGTIDLATVESYITERSRAVIVSHMWGRAENVTEIRAFCDYHGLYMIEDCSHAHGARFEGVSVGSLADVAAWSLQASKLVPAGEGGVIGTNSREVFERALLLGHFNQRCIKTISPSSPNNQWVETGLGLKYRAHPLGIAMATVYLKRLQSVLNVKKRNAERLTNSLSGMPITSLRRTHHPPTSVDSYYSFVMLVDESKTEMTPKSIVTNLAYNGFGFADVPIATRPLHEFPLFMNPVSPVVKYDRSCVRGRYPHASQLSRQTFKIPVPHVDGDVADLYCESFNTSIQKVMTAG